MSASSAGISRPARGRLSAVARLLAVFSLLSLFCNVPLGIYLWFPGYQWWRVLIPVPEAAAAGVLLSLLALPQLRGRRLSAGILWLLAAALSLLTAFSLAEAFFQHVYRRPFRIGPNLPLAEHFFNMLFDTALFSRPLFLLAPALAAAALCTLLWRLLLRGGISLLRRPPAAAVPLLLLLVALSLVAVPQPLLSVRLLSQLGGEEGLPATAGRQRAVVQQTAAGRQTAAGAEGLSSAAGRHRAAGKEGRLGAAENAPEEVQYALPGIRDADIHLFVAESYGMTVFTNPHHRRRLAGFYEQAEAALAESGFAVRSWAYESTAFGGTSWLADAALITGLPIDSQHKYDQAVAAARHNLLHILRDRGYRRVLSAPGTSFMDEEHRRFYDFSRYLMFEDFGYQGPYFAYGRMPDQYQLSRAAEEIFGRLPGEDSGAAGGSESARVGSREEAPLFVQYMLCSSHVPWNYIPPYRQSWSFPEGGRVYYDRSRNTYYENSWAAGSELFAGYAHSIRYTMQTVFGYIRRQLAEGGIAVIIGDHQPKFPVSEKGASFAVPIHLISRQERLLEPFERYGYVEGLHPPMREEYPGIERFLGHFLAVAEGRVEDRAPPVVRGDEPAGLRGGRPQ